MVSGPARGEVWWAESPSRARRPYLIMTRSAAIPVLNSVLAAPLTMTIRNLPTELLLSTADGMPQESVASFDNMTVIAKSHLVERITKLKPAQISAACRALQAATGC
ncbi:MAG: type II toxin-antitoxin system PemK/MazF family toxin [bacterium]|nr:type II toxin-antitoxin system PemK/MazF family toxin [bacterium]